MGHTRGRRSVVGSGNAVVDELFREKAGNRGTVGGVTPAILGVSKGEGVQRWWVQEGGLVVPRGDSETTSGHPGRNLMGE